MNHNYENLDEDNQSLIDEIQVIEGALVHKDVSSNDNLPSTSSYKSPKVVLKTEHHGEREEIEHVHTVDDNERLVIDDRYDECDGGQLQKLLSINKKLIGSILAAQDKMNLLLEECRSKQRYVEEQIGKQTHSTYAKIITFNAGMPYFKDKNYFTPQRNEDTEIKIKNDELRLVDLPRIHRWNQPDKSNLLKAIRHEVTLTLIERQQSEEEYISDSIKKVSQLPLDVKKAIGNLGTMKFDWLKIANNMTDNKHSAEECEVMWNIFLHPDINKQKWTLKEDKTLNRVVDDHRLQDWDSIAKALNSNRSGYQCFVRYNTNNYKNLMRGQSWLPEDDRNLLELVSKVRIGDYIPWGYISCYINNWTYQQIYFHWIYSLNPHLKKGRFSIEEDKRLLEAVAKYGLNFSKISALALTNRTNVQLKEHYQTLVSRSAPQNKRIWSYEEDAKLVELKKKYGSNWAKIVQELPNTNRVQARHRFSALMRFHRKGITINSITRPEDDTEDPLQSPTMVTYTSNTPWSRENKDIFVKHVNTDNQLIQFFKKELQAKKMEDKNKTNDAEKLNEDTIKLYKNLLNLDADIDISEVVDYNDELSKTDTQLLLSLYNYIEEKKSNLADAIESRRLEMFGPRSILPEDKRFIPPLPFGFCNRRKLKKDSNSINVKMNNKEFHQIDLIKEFEPDEFISECLGEECDEQFEKFRRLMVKATSIYNVKKRKRVYTIKCKSFASSNFINCESEQNIVYLNVSPPKKMKYDWEFNKMVCDKSQQEKLALDSVPVSIIKPDKITVQAYQEILFASSNFPTDSGDNNPNYKLTERGQLALQLFKRRYQQLFEVPAGLSRIIPPDIVDESAFLPVLEKFDKKNPKKKILAKSIVKVE